MTTISELVTAFLGTEWDDSMKKHGKRNFTDLDRQAAESAGIRLSNNTRDPRILKLLSDVHEYAQGAFRQDFETALEREITCLQETGLTSEQFDTAIAYAKKLVNDRVRQTFETVEVKDLVTPYSLSGGLRNVGRQNSHMEIDIGVYGLVGAKLFDPRKRGYHTQTGSSDDAKKVAHTFRQLMVVDLGPHLDLQARRLDRPSINELHEPFQLPGGRTFFYAYGVQTGYRTNIPIGMMHALYEQSQKVPAG